VYVAESDYTANPESQSQAETADPGPAPPRAHGLGQRWLKVLLGIVLVAVAFASTLAGLEVMLPHKARALLQLEDAWTDSKDPKKESEEFRAFRNQQAALIRREDVLKKALANPSVAALPLIKRQTSPEQWLQQHLQVDFPIDRRQMRVMLLGEEPQDLVVVLNAVVDAYVEEVRNSELAEHFEILKESGAPYYQQQLRGKREQLARLTAGDDAAADPGMEIAKLKAEIARLQEALHQIEDLTARKSLQGRAERIKELTDGANLPWWTRVKVTERATLTVRKLW
jgi:hypothetical protein